MFIAGGGENASNVILETWRHDNQNAAHPSLIASSSYGNGDYYVKDVSYLRCRNITLGYVVPLPKKILNRARIYVDVNNPFVITNWTGLDPETDLVGSYAYPNITSLSFGVDITF